MIVEGKTERLILKPLELADAPQIQAHFPQWEIVRYFLNHDPWPYPPDGAQRYVGDIALPQMERGDTWHWSLRLRIAPEPLIGTISLMKSENRNRSFWMVCRGRARA